VVKKDWCTWFVKGDKKGGLVNYKGVGKKVVHLWAPHNYLGAAGLKKPKKRIGSNCGGGITK